MISFFPRKPKRLITGYPLVSCSARFSILLFFAILLFTSGKDGNLFDSGESKSDFPLGVKIKKILQINSALIGNQKSIKGNKNAFITINQQPHSSRSKLSPVIEGREMEIAPLQSEGKKTLSVKPEAKKQTTLKVCKNCKKNYDPKLNTDTSCLYHPGHYSGRLNRINDVDTSDLEYFHSCCGEYDKYHPGCVQGKHVSYDEEETGWISKATGKRYV